MNSYIVDCLEPQPGSFTSTLRADARPHEHASSGWGGAPLCIQTIPAGLWSLALRDCRWVRSGHFGDGRHPGITCERVADGGEGVGAVLDGGGRVLDLSLARILVVWPPYGDHGPPGQPVCS